MKLAIDGKVYDAADLDQLSLRDILMFEKESADMGRPMSWADIGVISTRIDALKTKAEKEADPGIVWMTAVTIWASRRLAGENITFEQAVDFPMRSLTFLPEPQDRKAAGNPTKARPGSGRAANRRPGPVAAPSPQTSEVESTAG